MSSVTIYFYLFFFKVALKQRKTPYTIKLAPQKYNAGSSLLPAIRLSNKKCIHSAIKIIKMLLQFQKLRFNNCVNPRYKSVISFIWSWQFILFQSFIVLLLPLILISIWFSLVKSHILLLPTLNKLIEKISCQCAHRVSRSPHSYGSSGTSWVIIIKNYFIGFYMIHKNKKKHEIRLLYQ